MDKEQIQKQLDEIHTLEDRDYALQRMEFLVESIIDPNMAYCGKCGACGEPPCCDFSLCSNLRCEYGDDYIRSYSEMSKEIERLELLGRSLDWQEDFPFDSFGGMYLWVMLDPDNDDLEMGGLCTVWEICDVDAEIHQKKIRKEENVYFYNIGDVRFCMYFYGYSPIRCPDDNSPHFTKIAKIQLPPQPKLFRS